MVTRLDREVGRILDLLAELGLEERTIVVFTSDNGPTFDAGGADSAFFRSAGPFRGLKGSLYEGGLRVPAIVSWKGRVAAGVDQRSRHGIRGLAADAARAGRGGVEDAAARGRRELRADAARPRAGAAALALSRARGLRRAADGSHRRLDRRPPGPREAGRAAARALRSRERRRPGAGRRRGAPRRRRAARGRARARAPAVAVLPARVDRPDARALRRSPHDGRAARAARRGRGRVGCGAARPLGARRARHELRGALVAARPRRALRRQRPVAVAHARGRATSGCGPRRWSSSSSTWARAAARTPRSSGIRSTPSSISGSTGPTAASTAAGTSPGSRAASTRGRTRRAARPAGASWACCPGARSRRRRRRAPRCRRRSATAGASTSTGSSAPAAQRTPRRVC